MTQNRVTVRNSTAMVGVTSQATAAGGIPKGMRAALLNTLLGVVLCAAQIPVAEAVRGPSRAINQAIQTNIRNAVERLKLTLKVEEPSGAVVVQETSLDGRYMLLIYEDNRPKVLDFIAHEVWEGFTIEGSSATLGAISPSGDFVVAQADGTLSRWRLDRPRRPERVVPKARPGARYMLHGVSDAFVVLDDRDQLVAYPSGLSGAAIDLGSVHGARAAIALDSTGNFVAAQTSASTVQIWEVAQGLAVSALSVGETSSALVFGGDSTSLFTANNQGIQEWRLRDNAAQRRFPCTGRCDFVDVVLNEPADVITALDDDGVMYQWRLSNPSDEAQILEVDEGIDRIATTPVAPMMVLGLGGGLIRFQPLEDESGSALTLASSKRGWAMLDDSGRFDGTVAMPGGIAWEGEGYTFPIANFVENYFEPGLFGKWVEGRDEAYLTSPADLAEGVLRPPEVSIEVGGDQRSGGRLAVTVTRKDQGGGLGELFLFHQGLKVSQSRIRDTDGGGDGADAWISETFEVFAMPGTNTFQAKTRDTEGVMSPGERSSLFIPLREQRATLHVLAVAIDDYADPLNQLNLNYAVADASGLSAAIKTRAEGLFDEVVVTQVLDAQADRSNVLAALSDLKRAQPGDTVVIYFATHGEVFDDDFYLLLQGLKLPIRDEEVPDIGISVETLSQVISDLDARRVFLLLDTCKSGDAVTRIANMGRDQRALQLFSSALGVHLIAATGKGQNALEVNTLGHGVFTHTLLNALRGEADSRPFDQIVTAAEIGDYAAAQVMALTRRLRLPAQNPTVFSQGFDFRLGMTEAEE